MLYIIGIATIAEYFHTGDVSYKEIINYELDITNLLINSPQIHDIKVLNITNPQFNEQISLASRKFVNARFQCITKICFKTATLSYIIGFNCISKTITSGWCTHTVKTNLQAFTTPFKA